MYFAENATKADEYSDAAERVIGTGVYAHAWKKGDVVLWDNRQLLHAASPFDADKYQRLLFRAEFAGEAVLHGA